MAVAKTITSRKKEFENTTNFILKEVMNEAGTKKNPFGSLPTFKLVRKGLVTLVSADNLQKIDWDKLLQAEENCGEGY